MEDLPLELLDKIMLSLSLDDLKKFRLVGRRYNDAVQIFFRRILKWCPIVFPTLMTGTKLEWISHLNDDQNLSTSDISTTFDSLTSRHFTHISKGFNNIIIVKYDSEEMHQIVYWNSRGFLHSSHGPAYTVWAGAQPRIVKQHWFINGDLTHKISH
jgi:hypothetical protein